jgi:hypothetical protein
MSEILSEQREVTNFHSIALEGAGKMTYRPGTEESLTIEADARVIPHILTEVHDGRLIIRREPSWRPDLPGYSSTIRYWVTVKQLDGIEISGAAAVTGFPMSADRFQLTVTGAADVQLDLSVTELESQLSGASRVALTGTSSQQTVSVTGAGHYEAADFPSQRCWVNVSGAGSVSVHALEALSVSISGSATVSYRGNPTVQQRISGVGRITRRPDPTIKP